MSRLPPRPLRLRRAFAIGAWARALGVLAPAIAIFAVVALAHGRGAYALWLDHRTWQSGERAVVRVTRLEEHAFLGVHHVLLGGDYIGRDGEARRVRAHYYALFADPLPRGELLPIAVDARGDVAIGAHLGSRWAFFCVVFGALALLALAGAAIVRKQLEPYRTARFVARFGEERELEVVELLTHTVHDRPAILEVRYRAPAGEAPRGYRDDARERGEIRSQRFRLEAKPILIDENARVLALCAGDRATLVREDLWPFQPSPSSGSAHPPSEPASAMGAQRPPSANT